MAVLGKIFGGLEALTPHHLGGNNDKAKLLYSVEPIKNLGA